MREAERLAIEDLGVPGAVLMEHAAIGVVDAIGVGFPQARRVACFCGPGNNGGDGLAIARLLDARGYEVELFAVTDGRAYCGDAALQWAICDRLGLKVREVVDEGGIATALEAVLRCHLVVDALFGTGLARPLEGIFGALVTRLSDCERSIVAVDIPSGLDGSSGALLGVHLAADLTVTFGAPKVAHVMPPASESIGELVVSDLGVPPRIFESAPSDLSLLEAHDMRLLLPPRSSTSHKGTYGHTLVVAGSEGKSGAALLATRAAIRSGSGLVTVAVPEPLLEVLESASLESMTIGLPVASGGGLSSRAYASIVEAAEGKQAVALGPGLGTVGETVEVARRVVADLDVPIVLDADGLNAFADRPELLRERRAPLVATPHPGELGRLLGSDAASVEADRLSAARAAVEVTGGVVILKGHRSLIADEDGIAINPTGNPGMATGGTGDVLTGLVSGFVAQGRTAVQAAQLGAYVHGRAGDLAAADLGEPALTASDLLDRVPAAISELANE